MVMQERKLRKSWEKFWKVRKNKPVDYRPFYYNFKFLQERLRKAYRPGIGCRPAAGKSLEVGAGRAIMSDYLHAWGWDTYCVDKYYKLPKNGQTHKYFTADAFNLPFPDHFFDLVFSYGLLEHFKPHDQLNLVAHFREKVSHNGISLHYIVPKKLVNIFEDDDVYRDRCQYFLNTKDIVWVYPAIWTPIKGQAWENIKIVCKGFWYADISPGDSKVNECKSTEQEQT
jgi:hypothetical protein